MSDDQLTNSERYVKKTNTIILVIGLVSLLVFIFGLILLISSGDNQLTNEEIDINSSDDPFINQPVAEQSSSIEIVSNESDSPFTATPDPIPMGEVVLGTEAKNVLTIGTNGKSSIVATLKASLRGNCLSVK